MLLDALAQTGKTRPRVCLVLTASGDDVNYYYRMYEAFAAAGCDVTEMRLFTMPSAPPDERLGGSDLIWVGGGSVANLLELWRLHGIDTAMQNAWDNGVILSGVSAGSICWHTGGTTDSFGYELRAVTNGLGLIPAANGVHYDSEAQRRPLLHQLVGDGTLSSTAYATDDHVGIWYHDDRPFSVVGDSERRPDGPAAYVVERSPSGASETRVEIGSHF
jgi:peptidase E